MEPLIVVDRAVAPGGLWTPTLTGSFKEGNASLDHFVTGHAHVKELNGRHKLFFSDVKIEVRHFMKAAARKAEDDGGNSDASSDAGGGLADAEEEEAVVRDVPALHVYLSALRPKARMIDIHKRGANVLVKTNPEHYFGRAGSLGDFSLSLQDIPDIHSYQGLVIVKRPEDAPTTDEPMVYGFVRFITAQTQKLKSMEFLQLSEMVNVMNRALRGVDEARPATPPGQRSQKRAAAAPPSTFGENVRSVSYYRKQVERAWTKFDLKEDDEVPFDVALKMLDFLNVFIVDVQAERIFNAVDLQGDRELGMSEFENLLIGYDLVGPATDLTLLDVYDGLRYRKSEKFDGVNPDGVVEELQDDPDLDEEEREQRRKKRSEERRRQRTEHDGLDFSGFVEAVHMLGGVLSDENELMKVFCEAAGVKVTKIHKLYVSHHVFKKAFFKVADIEKEMHARNLKLDRGVLGMGRNRERLNKYISDYENAYLKNIAVLNDSVERLKKLRREKQDARKQEAKERRQQLQHEADRFSALRNQEKRLELKRDQEDRAKKRLEEKVIKNKLLLRQAENKLQKEKEIRDSALEKERLRLDEIRAMGLDRLDLSMQELRYIPKHYTVNSSAQRKLTYLNWLDMSRNMLDKLPEVNFFFNLTALRFFKASQNRLARLPEEEFHLAVELEIVELDSNRLTRLPPHMGDLQALQRLDLSNNRIKELPSELGDCVSLKYLNLHSNDLSYVPNSLGNLVKLEYMNLSRNQLLELPEDFEYLCSMRHFDIASNKISALPTRFGKCIGLSYFDASVNRLAYLPPNFSELVSMEYLNLENNNIDLVPNQFNHLSRLRELKLKNNRVQMMFGDIGGCVELTKIDLSANSIRLLPPEFGLCVRLQEVSVRYNCMTTIPPELGSCGGIQSLDMSYNEIEGPIPETVGQMANIRKINLSFNRITHFPRSVIGLIEITSINVEKNKISSLPDTFTTMNRLTEVDFSMNEFSRFPIELKAMQGLQSLCLKGNIISLLPRNINEMSFLTKLDLSGNKLVALPVEFVEVFESVPDVGLDHNPWTALPERWVSIWRGDTSGKRGVDGRSKHADVCPTGNSVTESIHFLYGMREVYNVCEYIWRQRGAAYYSDRLRLVDFLKEVQTTIPKTWHDGLTDHVEYLYFKSKETGNYPLWYSIDEDQSNRIRNRTEKDAERREKVIENTRREHAASVARMEAAYDPSNVRLAIEERMHRDMHKPSELMRKAAATESLRVILRQREKRVQERIQKKHERVKKENKEEAHRLISFAKDLNIKLSATHPDENF